MYWTIKNEFENMIVIEPYQTTLFWTFFDQNCYFVCILSTALWIHSTHRTIRIKKNNNNK